MSMLAFGKKGTRRPPLFHHIMHPRHTSPHLFWPLARKTSALIVCDGFSPGNKTREDEEDRDQTKDGRDGAKRSGGGGGGVMREEIKQNGSECGRKGQRRCGQTDRGQRRRQRQREVRRGETK